MLLRGAACLWAFGVFTILQAQPMFEGSSWFGDQELKGKPKFVRLERESLSGDKPDRVPEEESGYREDGKIASQKRYSEGKLIADEVLEYDLEGHRRKCTTRDGEGRSCG